MRWALVIVSASLAACTGLDPKVLYKCESDHSCSQSGFICEADGYCHPPSGTGGGGGSTGGGAAGGGTGGGSTGGGAGGGGGFDGGSDAGDDGGLDAGDDAGMDAGEDAGTDGGTDGGCTSAIACPAGAQCGFFDAGCGVELDCGTCAAPDECGTSQPLTCGLPRLCTAQGWCFENPLPQGYTVHGGYESDPRHVFWVGDNGLVLFFDGQKHSVMTLPPTDAGYDLLAVDGTGPADVYAVGTSGTILHFDGGTWKVEQSKNDFWDFQGVVALSGGKAIAVGTKGIIFRRDSNGWTPATGIPFVDFGSVAVSGSEAYAMGVAGAVLFKETPFGSNSWMPIDNGELDDAFSIAAAPGGALLVAGARSDGGTRVGTVMRRDSDGGWSVLADVAQDLKVVRSAGSDFYAAGDQGVFVHPPAAHLAGLGWNALVVEPAGARVEGELGTAAVYDAQSDALVVHSAGSTRKVNAICGSDGFQPFAASDGVPGCTGASCTARVLDRQLDAGGVFWSASDLTVADTGAFGSCTSRSGFDYLVGDGSRYVYRVGGVTATIDLASQGLPAASYLGAWQHDLLHVYFINHDTFAAQAYGPQISPFLVEAPFSSGGLSALSIGGAPGQDYVVGQGGLVLTFTADGGLANAPSLGTSDLNAVRGEALDDGGSLVLIGGNGGALYRNEGGVFFNDSLAAGDVQSVWAGTSGDGWAAASLTLGGRQVTGIFRRAPGQSWKPVPILLDRPPRAIWGAPNDGGTSLWLGASGGLILRKDN